MHEWFFHTSVRSRMWISSWVFACMVFVIAFGYTFVYYRGDISLAVLATAIAATAAVCIGSSLALSGFAYYFDFLDTKVAYRKYLGLVGYWVALLYCVLLIGVNPARYGHGLLNHFFTADVLLGLIAMTLLTYTAVISNGWAMRVIGVPRWRQHLRISYLAYALLIVRAFALDHALWSSWFDNPAIGLPPPRLLVTLFALCVLALRGSMLITSWYRQWKLMQRQIDPNP